MMARSIGEILDLYVRRGSEHYDETISQLDHALQSAALATDARAADTLIAASLLHDVGHLLDLEASPEQHRPAGSDRGHEATGCRYLSGLFPPAVTAPIALHVRAKRYLCATDLTYQAQLSDGSKRSLELQGGPLSAKEVAVFERHPSFEAAVLLRAWDDRGKVDGLDVFALETYRPLLERLSAA